MVRVQTSGRDINMLIDSGTGKNIISEKTYIETWVKSERPRIEKDATKLVQWNRQRLSILGKIRADVKVNKRIITMELLVVEGPGPNLIGREVFDQIGIGLEWINYGDSVCQITEEFMDVFKEKLGQYRGPPIHIKNKTLGKPTFLRARTLPYAIRPKVEEALRKMEEQGILTPVEFTRFATPIVPVLKRDGSIRICGDYRSTVNTIVESDTFPVPAADLQVNLAGGKVFSKLDLKDAYQQLVVDEETAELLAINTHKGLFKWPEAIIKDHCTATATVRVLRNLFAVHGLPDQVVSDNGRMFVGHEFQEFLMMNGIRHITSAPYHPQTNGQAERVVQTLKQLIRKNGWENISVTLPRALFAIRTTPHGTTGLTPAELLMGRRLTTRMNRLHPKESEDSENGKEHFQNRFKSQENVYARKYNGKGKGEDGPIRKEETHLASSEVILPLIDPFRMMYVSFVFSIIHEESLRDPAFLTIHCNLGRLGNQMGTYAILLGLSHFNKRTPYVRNCNMKYLAPYFMITAIGIRDVEVSPQYRYQIGTFLREEDKAIPPDKIFLDGYLYPLSFTFFHHIRDKIKSEFSFNDDIVNHVELYLAQLRLLYGSSTTLVSIDLRRTDYEGWLNSSASKGRQVDMEYFNLVMKYFEDKYEKMLFVVMNDDRKWRK
ncbi:K02A2.6-like [Cordylochernes scorpioides]|uniref:K02A2.6-like n=1 Tax=Cordylochernes scorpioides TaxID=51811 RepID=A0ABY6K476_9ARAC|nr:K02A2.6-like [Cordylochernes scorpioides]